MSPKALRKGDTVGLIAPSKPLNREKEFEVKNFIQFLGSQGLRVRISKNFYETDKFGANAGTPQQRADDINDMFSDDDIKAIWCLQGGSAANQTLDLIDFDNVRNNPKIFVGKSDIDVLSLALNKKTGLITFHGCDSKIGSGKEMDFDYTKRWFVKRLFEGSKTFEPSEEWHCINGGKAVGKIIGCNLRSILKLAGTGYFPDFTDSIMFIETFKSYPGEIIAQVEQLRHIGVFKKVRGIVVGNNYGFQSEKFTVEQIIKDLLEDHNFPILKIGEFGHYQPHAFLPIGAVIELDATDKKIRIIEEFLD